MGYVAHKETVDVSPATRYRIELVADDQAESPREWDNVAEMWCWHRRYNLGDRKPRYSEDFAASADGIRELIEDQGDEVLAIRPLFLYDHSGITISTKPFSCRWDSGQVGWVFVRASKADSEGKSGDRAWAEAMIEGEVETYDQFLRGDVYGYRLFRETLDVDGEVEDDDELASCWGFYGEDYCLSVARDELAAIRRNTLRQRIERLKTMIRNAVPLAVRQQQLGPAFA
ncbi:MAG: hypothetical protein QJR02_01765 [Sinobacteraceae bacterium]|nr:hypothetical protein [Nevskiaceae bacterium]